MEKLKLSTRETAVLALLAQGDNLAEIKQYLGISLANIYVVCNRIRLKTGIKQVRDPEECKRALALLPPQKVQDALIPPRVKPGYPTYCELDAFRLLMIGHTYDSAAALLDVKSQSFQNLLSRGCKRAGIEHHGWDRNRKIIEWIKKHDGITPPSPMDDPAFN